MAQLQVVEPEHQDPGIVPLGGKLPHFMELRTSALLDCLQALFPKVSGKRERKRLNASLASKARLGMYLEINAELHLAYADQRDGRGSQHYWRLFYSDQLRPTVEAATNRPSCVPGTGQRQEIPVHATQGAPGIPWSGMYFRSRPELTIAKALQRRGLLFFANSQGMGSLAKLPVTRETHGLVERLEVDFLVFHHGHCMALEVDGKHHQNIEVAHRDMAKERVLLQGGIPTVRFPAQLCIARPDDVVEEFLSLFMPPVELPRSEAA